MEFVPGEDRYNVTGRLEAAAQYFPMNTVDDSWDDDVLHTIHSPEEMQNDGNSGSIMLRASMSIPAGNVLRFAVKAFPHETRVDAMIESHVSCKIRRLMDVRECPFFVLPFAVITKYYNEREITTRQSKTQNFSHAEKIVLELVNTREKDNITYPFPITYFILEDMSKFVTHKNGIAKPYDCFNLLEWMSARNLFRALLKPGESRKLPYPDNRVMKEIIVVLLQVMEALKVMEKHGITHNDLHWHNIFVQSCNHSFIVDGVHIESRFIAKIYDWDRAVCDDETCVKLRTKKSFETFASAHIHEYTPGYDLVGFFKNLEKLMQLETFDDWDKDNMMYDEREFQHSYKDPMLWMISEMLNPMAELFISKPSLQNTHHHRSNPCLTKPIPITGPKKTKKMTESGWAALEFEQPDSDETWDPEDAYPNNCMSRWTDDVFVPSPDAVTQTLLHCLLWAQTDPETPEFMLDGRGAFYERQFLGSQDPMTLFRTFTPSGARVCTQVSPHHVTVAQPARLTMDDMSPIVSIRATTLIEVRYENLVQTNDDRRDIFNKLRAAIIYGHCQYFVFPFASWDREVDQLIPRGSTAIDEAVMSGLQELAKTRFTIEENMGSSGTRSLDKWIQPKQRWQSINTMDFSHMKRGVMDTCITVLLQIILAIRFLEQKNLSHNGLGSLQNIFVQECEHSFWVEDILVTSSYLVKIGGWDTAEIIENANEKHRDLEDFATALLRVTLNKDDKLSETVHYYTKPLDETRSELYQYVLSSFSSEETTDVFTVVIQNLVQDMHHTSRRITTPKRHVRDLLNDMSTVDSPRTLWCRILEMWMQIVYEECDFTDDRLLLHRLEHASTYRINVNGTEKTIPAHALVVKPAEDFFGPPGSSSLRLTEQILKQTTEFQIKADERLLGLYHTNRSEKDQTNEQNKIKYVIVLMKELYAAVGYDREVYQGEVVMRTLYEHWTVASTDVQIIDPEHRALARGDTYQRDDATGRNPGASVTPSVTPSIDLIHVASRLNKAEMAFEKAVSEAHFARAAVYETAKQERGKEHAVLEAENVAAEAELQASHLQRVLADERCRMVKQETVESKENSPTTTHVPRRPRTVRAQQPRKTTSEVALENKPGKKSPTTPPVPRRHRTVWPLQSRKKATNGVVLEDKPGELLDILFLSYKP